jgi:glycosyltransferase involved in cell wall biosynthesis
MGMSKLNLMSKPLRLVYIIGRYPELTTTFIEREISVLRQLGYIEVQPVSIRYPLTPDSISPEHQRIREDTLYLVPENFLAFNLLAFILGNLYFVFLRPRVFFATLIYLLTHDHPGLQDRLKTILHFWQGVYASYLLRHWDFDHLHAHFIDRAVVVALVVGRLLGKPYSLTAHASNIYRKRILIREKIINAKFVVTVSQHNKAHLLKTYPGLDPEKIYVLHPWVNLSHFNPPANRPTHERLHILSVGRLVEKKGHDYLIEACHLLQKQGLGFECRIVGGGPLKPELEERITQYNLRDQVYLVGGQPQSEVLRLLATWADVFALPCVIAQDGDRDGIPVSLAEAMAMQLPVISTDIVGISELVQPGTGILVPAHNALALAETLEAVHAASPSARAQMGRRGREVVDGEFNLVKGVAQLACLFREAVA